MKMFYGLLLENSGLGELGVESVDSKISNREDDESWFLGLEAWVPCFSLPRMHNEANGEPKAIAACFGAE
jgi:hypothetical protein